MMRKLSRRLHRLPSENQTTHLDRVFEHVELFIFNSICIFGDSLLINFDTNPLHY